MDTFLALAVIVAFAALLGAAAITGHVHDSRDGADWRTPPPSRPDLDDIRPEEQAISTAPIRRTGGVGQTVRHGHRHTPRAV